MKGLQIYVYSRTVCIGVIHLWLFKDSILIWETGNVKKDGHTYIYWHISISKLFPHFLHPFVTFQRKMKEKLVDYFKNYWKDCKYMYTQEIVCIWVLHIWIFKDLKSIWERRGQQFLCLQSLRVFLLFKVGNVKKDGHTGGVREMSICRDATTITVNI